MSLDKEKARSGAATPERDRETRNPFEEIAIPAAQYITSSTSEQGDLRDYIPLGPESPVTGAVLAKMLDSTPREIAKRIQKLRCAGVPICASTGETPGYYIAEDASQLEEYLRSLKGRLHEITATATALGNVLDKMTGQQRIDSF